MTLFELFQEGTAALEESGCTDANIDAKQLLMAAFRIDMTHYLLNRMQKVREQEEGAVKLYRDMIAARCRRVPLQQILGETEFMGLPFYVNEHVLIPRQDTETLVEQVLKDCGGKPASLLDLCTGSGCIALSLAIKGSFRKVHAVDISQEALKIAGRNAQRLLTEYDFPKENFMILQGDLFKALPHDGRKYDIITSNPPYIPTGVIDTLEPEVKDHEPILALDGKEDGLFFYREIAAQAAEWLTEEGRVYLEIGYDQGDSVKGLMEDAGYREVLVLRDLAGNDRVVRACR